MMTKTTSGRLLVRCEYTLRFFFQGSNFRLQEWGHACEQPKGVGKGLLVPVIEAGQPLNLRYFHQGLH
jgi:hypothetical protein